MRTHRVIDISGATFISLLTAFLLLLAFPMHGSRTVMTLQDRVKNSDMIVHGAVVATSAKWVTDGRGKHIYTYATVNCFKYLKGNGTAQMVVEWPGGMVDQIAEQLSEFQPLRPGEEVVLFLGKDWHPAVGLYSKVEIVNGLAASLDRTVACTEFLTEISSLTGVKLPSPVSATPSAGQGVRSGGTLVVRADSTNISVPHLGPVAANPRGGGEPTGGGPEPAPGTVIYDNTTAQPNYYGPGSAYELLDFGTSLGGPVGQFTFAYVTTLTNPGNITIRFYSGTSVSKRGTRLASYTFSGLSGSPDGSPYLFTATYVIPTGQGFTLPNGAFGYSYQFANMSTGAPMATGGTGNEDAFWQNSALTWFGGPPAPYASFYMKMWAATGAPGPVIAAISPSSASAGTSTSVTLTGSNFGASQGSSVVEFFYRTGQPKIPATVTGWSDTSITCLVPVGTVNGYAGSAGSGPVTVTTAAGTSAGYNFIVPFGYGQYRWPGASPMLPYRINENCADCVSEAAAVQSAAAVWNNAGATFRFAYDGTTTGNVASQNFINEIMWGTCPAGVIAAATYWFNTTTMEIVECDIVFNDPDFVWNTSGSPSSSQMDVQTIATHELGHWLNLRDLYGDIGDGLNDSGKVMYGFGGNGLLKRSLASGDREGIRWIYGASVPSTLAISRSGGVIILTWTSGVLQQADSVFGPWSDVAGAASPYSTTPSGQRRFFRLH
jgi:hypothetical protein